LCRRRRNRRGVLARRPFGACTRFRFGLGAWCAADFDTGFRSATTAAFEVVAIRIVGGLAAGLFGRTLATSATRWASTFGHAAVG
jgi:hypothetical protein